MHRKIITLLALACCLIWSAEESFARGGRGGGGRGGGGFSGGSRGGGMSRPSVSHAPSMSRPSSRPSMSRPSSRPTSRPSVSRPSTGSPRPSTRPSSSASRPTSRPSLGSGTRPGGSTFKPGSTTSLRPSGNNGFSRPSPGSGFSNGRPNASQLGSFLDMPSSPGGSGNLGQGGNRPGGSKLPGQGSTFDNVLHNREPSTRPSPGTRPGTGDRPSIGDRPGAGDRPGIGDRPGAGDRPGIGDRPGGGDRPGIGDRPGAGDRPGPGDRPNRPGNGNRPGDGNRPGFDHDRNPNWANNIRNDWHNNWHNNNWHNHWTNINNNICHPGWGGRYGRYPNCYWHNHPHYPYGWWTVATAAAVGSWVGGGWGQPVYYDYGSGGNVVYEGDTVYVEGQPTVSAEQYASQAQTVATTGEEALAEPRPEDNQMQWMPLGVFSLSTSEDDSKPTRMLQMAVSKEGIINGTMTDTETNQTQPIIGAVDKETQRACWYIGDNKDVVAETGIYNLTKDQTPILVHYGSERTEEYLLVRLDPPEDAKQSDVGQTSTTNP